MAREHNIVSIDPDDATPGVVYLEDALKNHQSVEGVEAKVFSIHPCYYLIPQLLHGMNYILKWPIGRITEVSIDIGMDNFMRRYGDQVAVIEEVRADILLHGGDWSDKEFAFNRLRADFHTSKMVRWAVRTAETAMAKCDRVATTIGVSLHHMRQIAILSGLVQSKTIDGHDQRKMLDVVKWFGGVLEEKAGAAEFLKLARAAKRKKKTSKEWMEDPWSAI